MHSGYAVTMITDKDAHALRGIIEVMKRTNQDVDAGLSFLGSRSGAYLQVTHIQRGCMVEMYVALG